MSLKYMSRGALMGGVAMLALGIIAPNVPQFVGAAQAEVLAALPSYADVVALAKPAVVTVTVEQAATPARAEQGMPQRGQSPFDEFFRQYFNDQMPGQDQGQNQGEPMPQQHQGAALGSGFIISKDGTIVTNNHVVEGAAKITVTLDDGTELPATLIGADAKNDIAVLKVESKTDLPVLAWGDSNALRLGDGVIAIGNPFGIGTTITSGIVSARGRDLHNGPYDDFIQIDAAINHGNSGGPLIDGAGKVVGINSAIYSPNGGNVGVGFAIPAEQAQHVVAQILEGGTVEHGYLGVQIQPVDGDIAASLGLSDKKGALIAEVQPDSPAEAAGLLSGDVVLAIDGKAVDSPKDLSRRVADLAPEDKAVVKVWRAGKAVTVDVAIGRLGGDGGVVAEASPAKGVAVEALGITVATVSAEQAQSMGIEDKDALVVTALSDDSTAAAKGLRKGDVILSVNQTKVGTGKAFKEVIEAAKADGRKAALLQVVGPAGPSFVAVPFKEI